MEGKGEVEMLPQRQRCQQTPLLHSPLVTQAGELRLGSERAGHYPAALLKPENSGGCSTPFLPGWSGWVLMATALSYSLAKVHKC